MSWLCHNAEVAEEDWTLLGFTPSMSRALVVATPLKQQLPSNLVERSTEASAQPNVVIATSLAHEDDLEHWLASLSPPGQPTNALSKVNLIMGGRMRSLRHLPFNKPAFSRLQSQLMIHGSIVRVINRNTSCFFSSMSYKWTHGKSSSKSLVYNCRTSDSWGKDMALSVTFFPETLTTNAFWYGCSLTQHDFHGYEISDAELITRRLSNFDGKAFHPLMLPTMFAEFERERQIGLVRKRLTQLVQRICDLSRDQASATKDAEEENSVTDVGQNTSSVLCRSDLLSKLRGKLGVLNCLWRQESSKLTSSSKEERSCSPTSTTVSEDEESTAILWIETSHLRNGLATWRTQLVKMIEHAKDLETTNFGVGPTATSVEWRDRLAALRESGCRIKGRLRDLVDEYDEFMRTCTHSMEGLALASQLEMNSIGRNDARTNQKISSVNLDVAKMARRDGSLMKSLALLGMIFLPGTFISSMFSMDFFEWTSRSGNIVSPYIWIYAVALAALTILTVGAFYFCSLRRKSYGEKDIEGAL